MAGIYYEKIDVEGHHFGPLSSQVQNAVNRLDLALQYLNRKIKVRFRFFFPVLSHHGNMGEWLFVKHQIILKLNIDISSVSIMRFKCVLYILSDDLLCVL